MEPLLIWNWILRYTTSEASIENSMNLLWTIFLSFIQNQSIFNFYFPPKNVISILYPAIFFLNLSLLKPIYEQVNFLTRLHLFHTFIYLVKRIVPYMFHPLTIISFRWYNLIVLCSSMNVLYIYVRAALSIFLKE